MNTAIDLKASPTKAAEKAARPRKIVFSFFRALKMPPFVVMKSATPSRTGRPIRAAAAIHGGLIRIKDASFDRVQGAAGDLFCTFQTLRI